MAIRSLWTFYAGEDVERVCTHLESEDDTGSIAGRNYTAQILTKAEDEVLVERSVGNGITISDAVNREYTIVLVRSETLELEPGEYKWRTWRADSGAYALIGYGPCIVKDAD